MNIQDAIFMETMPFKTFLLFDPAYKGMSDKAKILYSYIWATQDIKAYDENKYTYVKEDKKTKERLLSVLNCSKSTFVKTIKELQEHDLLEDINGKLYVLKPGELDPEAGIF